MFDRQYYEQQDLWNQPLEPYQIQVINDILHLIPHDAETVLDVGCGDGVITNRLPERLQVTGIDISASALAYVKKQTVLGSIEALPFSDASFDLVMVNDVLEHLDAEIYDRALEELSRVAKKYILTTMPFMENLAYSYARCQECGTVYHVNNHQRSFDARKLLRFFSPPWRPFCFCVTGGVRASTLTPFSGLKNSVGYYSHWDKAMCPKCGASLNNSGLDASDNYILETLGAIEQQFWQKNGELWRERPDRSECIVLWRKGPLVNPDPVGTENSAQDLVSIDSKAIYFLNLAFYLYRELPLHSPWPAFCVSGAQLRKSPDGLIVMGEENKTASIILSFPLDAVHGGRLNIDFQILSDSLLKLKVLIYRPLQTYFPIYEFEGYKGSISIINIDVSPGDYQTERGVLFKLEVEGAQISLRSACLDTPEDNLESQWLPVAQGHNYFEIVGDIIWRYGLTADYDGYIPIPLWFYKLKQLSVKHFTSFPINYTKTSHSAMRLLSQAIKEKERLRDAAERAYASAAAQSQEAEAIIADLRVKYEDVKAKYEDVKAKNEKLSNRLGCKVHRVLVLSHMFPNHLQPGSGSFVYEQVKALRKYELIDARVISCRPFWANTLNPVALLRAIEAYKKELQKVQWQEWDGVPVMYVPYIVGRLLRFSLHGYSYTWAVKEVINKIWRTFKFDLIHAHTAYLDGSAGVFVAKNFNLPLLITEHTGPFTCLTKHPLIRKRTLNSLNHSDKILTVSHSLGSEVCSYLPKEIHRKVQYLPNGVDTDLFYPNFNDKSNDRFPKILFIGYLEYVKGVDILLEAFRNVLETYPKAELTIVGSGTEEQALKQQARQLGIADRVCFTGYATREEVARFLQEKCDVFVLPSRSETFGVVVIEALACGKPVVATRCGGPESILVSPSLGRLCNPEDPADLKKVIIEVIEQIQFFDSELLKAEVDLNYSYKTIADSLSKIYEHL